MDRDDRAPGELRRLWAPITLPEGAAAGDQIECEARREVDQTEVEGFRLDD